MDLLLGHKEALQRCQRGGRRQAGARRRAVQVVTRDPSRGHSEPVNAVPMLHSSHGHSHISVPSRSWRPLHEDVPTVHARTHVDAQTTPSSIRAARQEGWGLWGRALYPWETRLP